MNHIEYNSYTFHWRFYFKECFDIFSHQLARFRWRGRCGGGSGGRRGRSAGRELKVPELQ